MVQLATGASYPAVSDRIVKDSEIPLPPIDEQRRIAAILDKADEVRAKRRAALETLETLSEAIFIDMFGDPVTNPMGLPVAPLGETVALVQIGPFGSLLHQSDYVVGGVPVINPMHINGGAIQPDPRHSVCDEDISRLSNYVLQLNDVVMGRRGEMGRCAVVGENEVGMLCGSGSFFIRPNPMKANSTYLCDLMSSRYMKRHLENEALGVTMPNLNSSIIEHLKIPLPDIAEQERYARLVGRTQAAWHTVSASAGQLSSLFASLQQRAFQGAL
jgi:type I restriction enzyme S subunit